MVRKATAVMLSALLAAILLLMAGGVSYADPVQEKKEQLENIKDEVQRIDSQLETVTEQYNLTSLRVEQMQARIAAIEEELAALNAELEERKAILGDRIRELYKAGNADILEVITESKTVDDLYTNLDRPAHRRRRRGHHHHGARLPRGGRGLPDGPGGPEGGPGCGRGPAGRPEEPDQGDLQRRQQLMSGVRRRSMPSSPRKPPLDRSPIPGRPPGPRPLLAFPHRPAPYAPAVVQVAYAQLGKPYRYAARAGCIRLLRARHVLLRASRVSLPHSSYMQARCGGAGAVQRTAAWRPGLLPRQRARGHVHRGRAIHPRTTDRRRGTHRRPGKAQGFLRRCQDKLLNPGLRRQATTAATGGLK